MTENIAEIWRPVKDYEELYKISNIGTLVRIGGSVERGNSTVYVPERVINGNISNFGYVRVKLTRNNKSKTVMLHRIVADAFLHNNENKRCVNHKDGNKLNNNVSNLEWVTHSENSRHAREIGLVDVEKMRKINRNTGLKTISNIYGWNRKRIVDLDTKTEYNSLTEAGEATGIDRHKLSKMLIGKIQNNTTLIFKPN